MSSENRTSVPNSLNEHWMPFTSNKDFKQNPRLITEAKGVYLKKLTLSTTMGPGLNVDLASLSY